MGVKMEYSDFLESKRHLGDPSGFEQIYVNNMLFDFQHELVNWSVRQGRAAIFADCGLGKTPIQLVWAENVARKTNKNVLILTPLAVSHQTVREGEKFGIECKRSEDGKPAAKITVTNYERLHLFDSNDYVGVVCDESSILKNFDGVRRKMITEFMRLKPYRLLCTATAAPNDYIELGTSSESLGIMGYMDMLNRFFRNTQGTSDTKSQWRVHGNKLQWRFKKHAQIPFWKWVCSWSRAFRRPSDMGFDDGKFILPPLEENQIVIENTKPLPGELFVRPAVGLREQRSELAMTLQERCEKVAERVNSNNVALVWCHLNKEGDLLEKLITDAVQVSGRDPDEKKEELLREFTNGNIRVLITKPKIAGFGLNWQHCSHMTFFPSHSFEQYYQGVRRCWRFGQENPVVVDVITTGGGLSVLANLQRKADAADEMFTNLVGYMNDAIKFEKQTFDEKVEVPSWL